MHWHLDGGNSAANIIAQRVGDLIKTEADVMAATEREQKAIDGGAKARGELQAMAGAEQNDTTAAKIADLQDKIEAGMEALSALGARKASRRKHAVASKNAGKIDSMLRTLSHHLRRPPDDFNVDAMLVATRSHTLRFIREVDPATNEPTARLEALAAHDRADLITALIPLAYDPAATCPTFLANMERFQPDPEQRRTVQQFSGLGLLGAPISKDHVSLRHRRQFQIGVPSR